MTISASKTASQVQIAQTAVAEVAGRARAASRFLAKLTNDQRNEVLLAVAKAIEAADRRILEANERDCRACEPAVATGKMSSSMFARLRVTERGVADMAARIREVVRLADPLGRRMFGMELDKDLVLYRETCPLGVIGIVFESRPDVVSQVASLTLKSGNAVILKGGAEAANTNQALVAIWRECLAQF